MICAIAIAVSLTMVSACVVFEYRRRKASMDAYVLRLPEFQIPPLPPLPTLPVKEYIFESSGEARLHALLDEMEAHARVKWIARRCDEWE